MFASHTFATGVILTLFVDLEGEKCMEPRKEVNKNTLILELKKRPQGTIALTLNWRSRAKMDIFA